MPGLKLLLAAALAGLACAPAHPDAVPDGEVRLSLLAVGDGGIEPGKDALLDPQYAVGRALAAEDRAAPVSALVLLGDNFYPRGLREKELAERIRHNVVRPYCHFVALAGPRSGEVADGCDGSEPRRPPIPLYAVLGNHDYRAKESPRLQRRAVPQFVSNWHMPRDDAEAIELGAGVSLVLYDSVSILWGDGERALRRALERSQGPWRILAAHHPLTHVDRDPHERRYHDRVERAIRVAGKRVHLSLAGHEHSLQLVELRGAHPALEVISGAGATARGVETRDRGLLFAIEERGYARVDLVADGDDERLVATLVAVGPRPSLLPDWRAVVASWSVDRRGRLRDEREARAR